MNVKYKTTEWLCAKYQPAVKNPLANLLGVVGLVKIVILIQVFNQTWNLKHKGTRKIYSLVRDKNHVGE